LEIIRNVIKIYGDLFAFEVPLVTAFFLGIIYIVAFMGAVYYGVDLCQKFKESVISKPIKIILVLTPISFIFYPPLLKMYPEEIVTINATVGVLEILSLIYLMIWQTIYIVIGFIIRGLFFTIIILIYMLIITAGLLLIGIDSYDENYVIAFAIGYRLFEIKNEVYNSFKDNFKRIYGNFIFNIRCVFSFN